jgi:hypothetical protein
MVTEMYAEMRTSTHMQLNPDSQNGNSENSFASPIQGTSKSIRYAKTTKMHLANKSIPLEDNFPIMLL